MRLASKGSLNSYMNDPRPKRVGGAINSDDNEPHTTFALQWVPVSCRPSLKDSRFGRSQSAPSRGRQQGECLQRNAGRALSALSLRMFVALIVFSVPHLVLAQTPPQPPPEREGSAEFAFVGTTGNSSTQTIGLGGEFIYRPSPWETRLKVSYVRNEAESRLRAQAIVLSLRAQRPIRPRLSGYGHAVPTRSVCGHPDRNAVEGGIAYSALEQAPTP